MFMSILFMNEREHPWMFAWMNMNNILCSDDEWMWTSSNVYIILLNKHEQTWMFTNKLTFHAQWRPRSLLDQHKPKKNGCSTDHCRRHVDGCLCDPVCNVPCLVAVLLLLLLLLSFLLLSCCLLFLSWVVQTLPICKDAHEPSCHFDWELAKETFKTRMLPIYSVKTTTFDEVHENSRTFVKLCIVVFKLFSMQPICGFYSPTFDERWGMKTTKMSWCCKF